MLEPSTKTRISKKEASQSTIIIWFLEPVYYKLRSVCLKQCIVGFLDYDQSQQLLKQKKTELTAKSVQI